VPECVDGKRTVIVRVGDLEDLPFLRLVLLPEEDDVNLEGATIGSIGSVLAPVAAHVEATVVAGLVGKLVRESEGRTLDDKLEAVVEALLRSCYLKLDTTGEDGARLQRDG
jgi:hypothetical protein